MWNAHSATSLARRKFNSIILSHVQPLLLAVTLTLPASGFALQTTFDFASTSAPELPQLTFSQNDLAVNISGWSGNSQTITQALVTSVHGLGARNTNEISSEPYSALDNYDGQDMLLFEFSTAVSLTSLSLEKIYKGPLGSRDADVSILAYTESGRPNPFSNGWQTILNEGWQSILNTDIPNTSDYQLPQTTTSNYWLIGAWNEAFGSTRATQYATSRNPSWDYFSLAELSVSYTAVSSMPPVTVSAPPFNFIIMLLIATVIALQGRSALRASYHRLKR